MPDEFTVVETIPVVSDEPPVFVLSFRQRDEVAAAAAGGGWRVVAARRSEGLEHRFISSGAAVAVIDARGALSDGLAATAMLGGAVYAHGAAMLILVSQSDAVHMRRFYDAGATHFLSSPMSSAAMAHAIRFAQLYAERVSGGSGRVGSPKEPLGWSFDPEIHSLQLTPALANLLSVPEAPGARSMFRRLDRADRRLAIQAVRRLRNGPGSTAFAYDLPGIGRVVQHMQMESATRRIHALIEVLGVAPDASVAVRDALTGARDGPSARRWIDKRIGQGAEVGVILIGLSRFDTVNRAYGREVGDELLRAVSRKVADVAREVLGGTAITARIAGSEFLVASEGTDLDELAAAVRKLEDALSRPFVAGGAIAPIGARLARAVSKPDDKAATLIRRASEALLGGVVQPAPKGPPIEELVDSLHHAMERAEIGVLFQPQVEISTGQITGVEALARWHHPKFGEIGAEALFATADQAGLSVALSDHVQRRALTAAAHWPFSLSRLRLSINVTAADVAREGFAEALLGRIDASGFPRSRLTIEITESEIMEDLAEASRLLSDLRSAGCRVAADDFGTGYSSLAYLKALPLDYLKIDKQLSNDITGSPRDRVVVRGVIDMARSLGISVVAEGVESQEQLDLLAQEGCQYFQGYLCSEPIDVPALAQLVARPQ